MPTPTGDFARWDTDKVKLFENYKKAGRIPAEYEDWDDLIQTYSELVRQGAKPKEALSAMGLDYKNVIGNQLIKLNDETKMPEINRRAIREDINPEAEMMIRQNLGDEAVEAQRARYKQNWFGTQEDARKAMQARTGSQQHRGHGLAAMQGGGLGKRNLWPEEGMRNSLHSSAPRWDPNVMEQMGVDFNDVQEAYNELLIREGLGVGDYGFTGDPDYELLQASDEYMVNPLRSQDRPRNIKGDRGYIEGSNMNRYNRNPDAFNPQRMAAVQDKVNQYRANPNVNQENVDKWVKNQSAKHSVGDATAQSGPVRQTAKPKPKVKAPRKPRAPRQKMTPIPPPIKRSASKRAARLLGPAAKLIAPAAIGAAYMQGGPANAAVTAVETLTPLGDIMADNTAPGTLAAEQRRVEQQKIRKAQGSSQNVQRETSRKRQERLRRERRAQESNPLAEVGTRAMQWLQELYR